MSVGFPKPRPRILDRCQYKRDLEAKDRAFRMAVWERDKHRCRFCDRPVKRTLTLEPNRGEVHHKRGRRVMPEHRFVVAEAVLLCAMCHRNPDVIAFYRRLSPK